MQSRADAPGALQQHVVTFTTGVPLTSTTRFVSVQYSSRFRRVVIGCSKRCVAGLDTDCQKHIAFTGVLACRLRDAPLFGLLLSRVLPRRTHRISVVSIAGLGPRRLASSVSVPQSCVVRFLLSRSNELSGHVPRSRSGPSPTSALPSWSRQLHRRVVLSRVAAVVGRSPLVQMLRVHAFRVVALVQHLHIAGDPTVGEHECDPVSAKRERLLGVLSGESNVPVSVWQLCGLPFPAAVKVGSESHLDPESFNKCLQRLCRQRADRVCSVCHDDHHWRAPRSQNRTCVLCPRSKNQPVMPQRGSVSLRCIRPDPRACTARGCRRCD